MNNDKLKDVQDSIQTDTAKDLNPADTAAEESISHTPGTRLAALVCVILLLVLVLCTLVSAFLTTPENSYIFRYFLIMTVVVPVLAYILIRFFRR